MKKAALALILALSLFASALTGAQLTNPVSAQTFAAITIKADGSVEGTTAIRREGNVYTFADNIAGSIGVERDNIILDGAGYTLSADLDGVELNYRRNVTVRNLVVYSARTYAFDLMFADDNTIIGNTITGAKSGIFFWFSWRNKVTENTIKKADCAIEFFMSPNHWSQENVVTKNTILECSEGIRLMESNNTFLDNIMNVSNLGVSISGHQNLFRNNIINCAWVGFRDDAFDNDIDESNLLNGKPVIYWIGHRDETVPSNAGYVMLSKCENIKVENFNLSDVTLFSTTDSLITGNTLLDGESGIKMVESSNNTIRSNFLTGNTHGIELTNCNSNEIIGNNINDNLDTGTLLTGSHYNTIKQNTVGNNGGEGGIKLLHSSNNHVIENNVSGNSQWGIRVLGNQYDNIIYHNNFIKNNVSDSLQVSMMGGLVNSSTWDDGAKGNYWSDYLTRYPNASEIGNTGIGNIPFYINPNNTDRYPLMEPFTISELPDKPETLFTPFLVAAVAVIGIAVAGLLVYFKTHRQQQSM
jgi:parallel beta-helix repeat protein